MLMLLNVFSFLYMHFQCEDVCAPIYMSVCAGMCILKLHKYKNIHFISGIILSKTAMNSKGHQKVNLFYKHFTIQSISLSTISYFHYEKNTHKNRILIKKYINKQTNNSISLAYKGQHLPQPQVRLDPFMIAALPNLSPTLQDTHGKIYLSTLGQMLSWVR